MSDNAKKGRKRKLSPSEEDVKDEGVAGIGVASCSHHIPSFTSSATGHRVLPTRTRRSLIVDNTNASSRSAPSSSGTQMARVSRQTRSFPQRSNPVSTSGDTGYIASQVQLTQDNPNVEVAPISKKLSNPGTSQAHARSRKVSGTQTSSPPSIAQPSVYKCDEQNATLENNTKNDIPNTRDYTLKFYTPNDYVTQTKKKEDLTRWVKESEPPTLEDIGEIYPNYDQHGRILPNPYVTRRSND